MFSYLIHLPYGDFIGQNKSFNQLIQILEKNPGEKLTLIYQWIKEDKITYQTFKGLLEWLNQYHEKQKTLDSI